jgi:hypothetical protein
MLFRRQPIKRLRAWVHVISSRFAFGSSLASYLTILVPATVFIYFAEQPLWAQELASTLETAILWKPFDERLLYVNAITSALVLMLAPFLYTTRRVKLYSDHRMQTKALREFAGADPDKLIQVDAPATQPLEEALIFEPSSSDNCFAILGISPAATADEIKEAYRAKIRQSHPDRVHSLAPAFRVLAEAETKKLNAAYEDVVAAQSTWVGGSARNLGAGRQSRRPALFSPPSCGTEFLRRGLAPGVPEDSCDRPAFAATRSRHLSSRVPERARVLGRRVGARRLRRYGRECDPP